jgi:hypothetical protein
MFMISTNQYYAQFYNFSGDTGSPGATGPQGLQGSTGVTGMTKHMLCNRQSTTIISQ